MKKNKLLLLISIVTVLLVGVASVSYAATTYGSPAEIIAGLTGKSVAEVSADRQAGDTYGAQANEAGKLAEFQTARLELYKQKLDQAVADQRITQEQADQRYTAMQQRLANCTGTGAGLGTGNGACTGNGNCNGQGSGSGMSRGGGMGMGNRGSGSGSGNTANK